MTRRVHPPARREAPARPSLPAQRASSAIGLPAADPSPGGPSLGGSALAHVACETLALGCLFERRGDAYIRVPVHRRQQAGGCEWHGRRAGGRLLGVSYTFESLEDWQSLACEAPERVLGLYRGILGRPDIPAEDLRWRSDVYARAPGGYVPAFRAGSYNPLNPWNTIRGAVHLNGLSQPGFEAARRPEEGSLRLAGGAPERGLLFLGGRDRTAAVLRGAPGQAARGRLEAAVPEGEGWSLDDLTLPGGEAFTPLGLFRALLGQAQGAWPARGAAPARQSAWRDAMPFLPGRLVTEALLRQAGLTPMGAALA